MGKSLESRLNGNKGDFLKDVENYGQFKALTMWRDRLGGYHDLIGLQNFLIKEKQNPNFGLRPLLAVTDSQDSSDALLDAVLRKFSALEDEKQRLLKHIDSLELELDYLKTQKALASVPKVRQIMTYCKES